MLGVAATDVQVLKGVPVSRCSTAEHPVLHIAAQLGAEHILVASSADRLSRQEGHLQQLTDLACGCWTLLTEVRVAAALLGWTPANLPPEPGAPPLLQTALGLDSAVVAGMDQSALESFNRRAAASVWNAIKQSIMERMIFLPMDMRLHKRTPGPVDIIIRESERQDANFTYCQEMAFHGVSGYHMHKVCQQALQAMEQSDERLRRDQLLQVRDAN